MFQKAVEIVVSLETVAGESKQLSSALKVNALSLSNSQQAQQVCTLWKN